jgi:hypothetical protein
VRVKGQFIGSDSEVYAREVEQRLGLEVIFWVRGSIYAHGESGDSTGLVVIVDAFLRERKPRIDVDEQYPNIAAGDVGSAELGGGGVESDFVSFRLRDLRHLK